MDYLEWIATAFGILGALLINYKNIKGFYAYLVANILFIIYGTFTHQLGIVVLFTVYTLLSIQGVINWKKL